MKLYDVRPSGVRVLAETGGEEELVSSDGRTVIDVNNVALYMRKQEESSAKIGWGASDFPHVVPPWPSAWFEYDHNNYAVTVGPKNGRAVMVDTERLDDEDFPLQRLHILVHLRLQLLVPHGRTQMEHRRIWGSGSLIGGHEPFAQNVGTLSRRGSRGVVSLCA